MVNLKISNVSKTYRNGIKALNNVSLNIPSGMFGLLGPNGAGKSTLMRILATLQEPDSGEISICGIDVIHQKNRLREMLGYLPQEFGLIKNARAEDLLIHFAILKGIIHGAKRREIVKSVLEQTNLWEYRKKKVNEFSGGMRQRFGVAVALLGSPRLMIVDEPTAGLDPAERVRFLNLLSELGENSVVILSTHIVEDVSELCTNMAIINNGEILMQNEPLKAVQALKGKIYRRLIDKKELPDLQLTYNIISSKLLSGNTILHIYSDLDPGNGFELVEPDLEDVYFGTIRGFQ